MSTFTIKQGYIVKSILIISLLFITSLGLIGGCSDDNNSINAGALTENDFARNSSLKADLDEGVVVTFLESPMSEEAEKDTGDLGKDDIPVRYDETTEQTFCWEDEDTEATHFMELRDSEGNLILTVHVNGDCVTEIIQAGDYVISIFHDQSAGDPLPIFLIPQSEELEETEQASKTDGFIDRIGVAAVNILSAIQARVTEDARAQTIQLNRQTLLSTNICMRCVLTGADLSGANLRRAILTEADLTDANLRRADLTDAILVFTDFRIADLILARLDNANMFGVDMRGANMRRATLTGADLTDADLSSAILVNADLTGAIMNDADLISARLINASMRGVLLNDANLTGADLTGADLINTELANADLTGATLIRTDFRNAIMSGAILSNANLTNADMGFAVLSNANLIGAILTGTDLRGATWCDGSCACAEGPRGNCTGCAPVEQVCTGP